VNLYIVTINSYNRRLNLVIVNTYKNVSGVRMFFDLIKSLYAFISGFSIRDQFVDIQNSMKLMPKLNLSVFA
jgi:hypothetical protein